MYIEVEFIVSLKMDDPFMTNSVNVCVEAPAENIIQEINYEGQEIYQL